MYKGPLDCAYKLYKNNGLAGFYKGYSSVFFFRTFVAFYFGFYEFYKRKSEHWHIIPEVNLNKYKYKIYN